MKIIINRNLDPYFNLAFEEYLLKEVKSNEDFFVVYRNNPSIIVGRNQNPFIEINQNYLHNSNIPIIRRVSGGGTVYHDLGNINYCFITSDLKDSLSNYKKFTKPIIDALNNLEIPAVFHGKSDIVVNGRKISGNAQSYYSSRMMHHGTILFDSNLDAIYDLLHKNNLNATSKSILSNKSMVTNIKTLLKEPMDIDTFIQYLIDYISRMNDNPEFVLPINNEDLSNIKNLSQSKYHSWKWNFGETPDFTIHHEIHHNNVNYEVGLKVIKGLSHISYLNPNHNILLDKLKLKYQMKPYQPHEFQNFNI